MDRSCLFDAGNCHPAQLIVIKLECGPYHMTIQEKSKKSEFPLKNLEEQICCE